MTVRSPMERRVADFESESEFVSDLDSASLPQGWAPSTWQSRPQIQQPVYADRVGLERALAELRELPPLVTSWEVLNLKRLLADAAAGRRFVLQGGDCAESFEDCTSPLISNRLKVMLQMSLVLGHGLGLPVVRIGRFAGQYAKPRSEDTETRDGVVLPSYRGDLVNGNAFSAEARQPNPQRLVQGHARSAMTMNFVRALIDGGFADLHHPEYWDLGWVEHSPLQDEYRRMVASIADSLRFMETWSGHSASTYQRVDFYTSHEALVLHYEESLTRRVPRQHGWFNLSTHFPWIGLRTNDPDGAHVEYFRGLRNPIAVKIGPSTGVDALRRLADSLDPAREPGRLSFIHRMGAARIEQALPPLLTAMRMDGREPLWICDPMHGNTEVLANGVKTRRFGNIRKELDLAFDAHAAAGTRLGGVHLELTGENVTECLGGARELTESDLRRDYRSQVDPRLNYEQSLEIALRIARKRHGASA